MDGVLPLAQSVCTASPACHVCRSHNASIAYTRTPAMRKVATNEPESKPERERGTTKATVVYWISAFYTFILVCAAAEERERDLMQKEVDDRDSLHFPRRSQSRIAGLVSVNNIENTPQLLKQSTMSRGGFRGGRGGAPSFGSGARGGGRGGFTSDRGFRGAARGRGGFGGGDRGGYGGYNAGPPDEVFGASVRLPLSKVRKADLALNKIRSYVLHDLYINHANTTQHTRHTYNM